MTEKREFIIQNKSLLQFETFEDYLESFITPRDLYHLRSKIVSRQIIDLGYHTKGTINHDTFYRRLQILKRYIYLIENPYVLCTEFMPLKDPLLKELQFRERANRNERFYTIIFMRYFESDSQTPLSVYIDYAYRLKAEDWMPYFKSIKRIKPKKNDLSLYSHKTGKLILNESPNFKPVIDGKKGFAFKNVFDNKLVRVSPNPLPKSDSARTTVYSDVYGLVVLYDHSLRMS